ncbi:T6SS amidase immunity protein Tai4 family protein [Klebsiella aerogenes]|nr:T6SS amidase immunity protein Tai4 family protein [Klebsiella aerogenes]
MKRMIIGLLLAASSSAYAIDDPVLFVKQLPYKQVVKDVVLSRCLAQVADDKSQFSLDAARSSNALLEWVPFDVESGSDKINVIIDKYKNATNGFHSERKPTVQGVTLNCLRLYHSTELDELTSQVIIGDPNKSWHQDNPQ